jgi:hypothetical protein
MIGLAFVTAIVVGPAAYFFAPRKAFRRRMMWTAVAVAAAYAAVIGLSIYLGDWLGAD